MANSIFQSVQTPKKRYNNFNLGREVLTSGQIGKLIPIQCDEVVPGDMIRMSAAYIMRFSPLSAPAMARFNVHFHTFFVPLRILTDESGRESTYERFIKSIGKATEDVPVLPYFTGNPANGVGKDKFVVGSLADYLGYPVAENLNANIGFPADIRASLTPFLAYQRIYQDFYRRDQLEQEVIFPHDVGVVGLASSAWNTGDDYAFPDADKLEANQVYATKEDYFKLQTRNYERDYFTSALPEPQFGDEVSVGSGEVDWIGSTLTDLPFSSINAVFSQASSDVLDTNFYKLRDDYILGAKDPDGLNYVMPSQATLQGVPLGSALEDNLKAQPISVNELRLAFQLQGVLEQINRTGTRYLEIMRGIYGVVVPDARLQRPIYLGGFKSPVTIGSVMQTSETNNTPQGTLTGQMSSASANSLMRGKFQFVEHGWLMTILSVTPRTSYYGGMPKKFTKHLPEEFYLPQFDHLGEQEIKRHELYFDSTPGSNNTNMETFGYTPRYAELKSSLSTVHGEFRTTLDNWHVSRDFDRAPLLNPDFIKAEPEDFDRIFAFNDVEGTSNEHFQCQIYLDVRAKRNMSKYSTPYTFY